MYVYFYKEFILALCYFVTFLLDIKSKRIPFLFLANKMDLNDALSAIKASICMHHVLEWCLFVYIPRCCIERSSFAV